MTAHEAACELMTFRRILEASGPLEGKTLVCAPDIYQHLWLLSADSEGLHFGGRPFPELPVHVDFRADRGSWWLAPAETKETGE